jgi:hypothetical protein
MEMFWDARPNNVRPTTSKSNKPKIVKSQKGEQDSLLTAVLQSGLISCTYKHQCDQFGLLRWLVFMTTHTQIVHRQTKWMCGGKRSLNVHIFY